MQTFKKGDWIEISQELLAASDRTLHLPEDTMQVPYLLRARGFASTDGQIGETVSIKTVNGRILTGKAENIAPSFNHDFGEHIPELIQTRVTIKKLIREDDE